MRRRTVWTIAAATAAVATGVGVLSASSVEPDRLPDDRVVVGRYSPSAPMFVGNRTIPEGTWAIGYSMQVLYTPVDRSTTLTCTIEDTSGRLGFFGAGTTVITPGSWQEVSYLDRFDLPELTLGVRCRPDSAGLMTAVFRNVELVLEPGGG